MKQGIDQYVHIINGLHENWEPHVGQIALGKALFNDGYTEVFGECGRNFGKTDFVVYALWRWAMMNPNSENYYFSPFMKQSREILWASGRLQGFGPKEWVVTVNNTEMRVTFTNGSFIKLDGSDNVDAYRGIKPKGLSIFDEFKDFRPEFYDAYDPNRAAFNSPLVIIGTPPDRECQFLEVSRDFKKNEKKFYYHGPSEINPHLQKTWLEAKKKELYDKGEGDVWEREYEAIYVPGGISKIFPMVGRSVVVDHRVLMASLRRDIRKLHWYVIADPAASTVFGVLFAALNPYTKRWYIVDELYETEQRAMSVEQIGKKIEQKKLDLAGRMEWMQVYDEAASWFQNEMQTRYNQNWHPTHKSQNKKDAGLSLIKDIYLNNLEVVSDRCVKYFWELDNYYKDKNGKIPKENDHLIDCRRYLNAAANYELIPVEEIEEEQETGKQWHSIADDFPELDDFGDNVDEWESY